MSFVNLPEVLFKTQKQFEDYKADDMQCGDMGEMQLRALGLNDISMHVDPFRLLRFENNLTTPYSGLSLTPTIPKPNSISVSECTKILFDEMRSLSGMFAHGYYSQLIKFMINHMQENSGRAFKNYHLDEAYKELITSNYQSSTTIEAIKNGISDHFSRKKSFSNSYELIGKIKDSIMGSHLPKYVRAIDMVNGLGITVHDIHAQEIILYSIDKNINGWRAVVHFRAQDHFGLDKSDVTNNFFNKFRFFRIWFTLQRYNQFSFKPFLVDFSTVITIEGN